MKSSTLFFFLILFSHWPLQHLNAQICECNDYIYLNDVGLGEVHKFKIDPATAVLTEIGSPWLTGMNSPHGLGTDLNGNLYIGTSSIGPIVKLNCNGGSLADTEEFNNEVVSLFHIGSVGNYIITTASEDFANFGNELTVFDACSGDRLGKICLDGTAGDNNIWGMQVLEDGTILIADGEAFGNDTGARAIWQFAFDPSLINASCIDPALPIDGVDPIVTGGYLENYDRVNGITSDGTYLYVMVRNDIGEPSSCVLQIDPITGNLENQLCDNDSGDGVGFAAAPSIVYSPASGYLYVSGFEDCLALVDPVTMTYLGSAVPNVPAGTPKAIAINTECCPTLSDTVIDQTFCVENNSEDIFINETLNCDGTVCEAPWEISSLDASLSYEPCNQSITFSGSGGCGVFTKTSDGVGANLQCGAFNITLNLCIYINPSAPSISITNNVCDPASDGSINIETPCLADTSIEYSTNQGTSWSSTAPTYGLLPLTVRARCVNDLDGSCVSEETADIVSTPEECCPPTNCISQYGSFTIIKNN